MFASLGMPVTEARRLPMLQAKVSSAVLLAGEMPVMMRVARIVTEATVSGRRGLGNGRSSTLNSSNGTCHLNYRVINSCAYSPGKLGRFALDGQKWEFTRS